MYFDSINDLIHMAGHGVYVWSAYVISISVLIGLVVYPVRKHRRALHDIRQRIAQQES
jgi:heme exporter protein D